MPKGVYKHKPTQGFRSGVKKPPLSDTHRKKLSMMASRWQKGRKLPEKTKIKLKLAYNGWNNGERSHFWKGGIACGPYSIDWTKTLKRAIRERDNYICQLCSQYGDNVHHIDYNKKNSAPDNLITLCRSCHPQTNKKRDSWIKFFESRKSL